MPQDAFTLNYICAELDAKFSGGKINRIIQPSDDEIFLTVYNGKRTEKLFISVSPSCPGIGVTDEEKYSPITAPNFCMLLRKHLLSATVDGVSLVGFDRIVKIDVTSSGEFFDARKKTLFVELMGRYSNVILTEDGKVLGCNRGINNFDNGVRPLICGKEYVFPPSGGKFMPSDDRVKDALRYFDGGDLAAFICERVQGLAQSTALAAVRSFEKESGRFTTEKAEKFFGFLNDFCYRSVKKPCVVYRNGKIADYCVFPYGDGGQTVFYDSVLAAEGEYFLAKEKQRKFDALYQKLNGTVSAQLKKALKKVSGVAAKLKDAQSLEENRLKGELLLANIYRIKQGDEKVTLTDYYTGNDVVVALDTSLSPSKNAERYYKKYSKQKRTLEMLAPQLENAEKEADYLKTLAENIELCEDVEDLFAVKEELVFAGYLKENERRAKKFATQPYRRYTADGFQIFCGKNNTDNDKLVKESAPYDLWLHAKDYHSAHVIIKTGGKAGDGRIPDKVRLLAAEICAYYSKGRGSKTEIIYTERKNVRKPKGLKPGLWLYENERSLSVMPNKHEELLKTD